MPPSDSPPSSRRPLAPWVLPVAVVAVVFVAVVLWVSSSREPEVIALELPAREGTTGVAPGTTGLAEDTTRLAEGTARLAEGTTGSVPGGAEPTTGRDPDDDRSRARTPDDGRDRRARVAPDTIEPSTVDPAAALGRERPAPTAASRAVTRDSSGERAAVAVPSRAPQVIERPQLADRRVAPGPAPSGDVSAAIATIQRCPTMQQCIQSAGAGLALFGYTAPLPDPGAATVANFQETRTAYRRALSEVRTAAKGLAESPAGRGREADLRKLFEALPQSAAFELEEGEIPALRRVMERATERWLTERRATITSALAMQVRLLTPAGGRGLSVEFEHPPSTMSGLPDLKAFLRSELASAKELKSFGRQRYADVKLVLNPGGRFGLK